MKQKAGFVALAMCLLLVGCGRERVTPSGNAVQSIPDAAQGIPDGEKAAAAWLLAENHDAFRVGDRYVTVEGRDVSETLMGETLCNYEATFSVWDPRQPEAPVQTMTKLMEKNCFRSAWVIDANFDGKPDFGYQYFLGNQPAYWYFWIWDEDSGTFIEEPAFSTDPTGEALGGISAPFFNAAAGTVTGFARSSGLGTGVTTVHRWEDRHLILVRRITAEIDADFSTVTLTVEEMESGTLRPVFRADYDAQSQAWMDAREHWEDIADTGV